MGGRGASQDFTLICDSRRAASILEYCFNFLPWWKFNKHFWILCHNMNRTKWIFNNAVKVVKHDMHNALHYFAIFHAATYGFIWDLDCIIIIIIFPPILKSILNSINVYFHIIYVSTRIMIYTGDTNIVVKNIKKYM